jgi:hypothetical protein
MLPRPLVSSFAFGLTFALSLAAQTTDTGAPAATVRDPRALAIANQSLQALAPLTALADVAMQGTVSREAGSDYQRGTFTFEASGNRKSRVTLNLDGGLRQEVRYGPLGSETDPDGQRRPSAIHNCWIDASWFYPGLSLQAVANDPEVSILYAGQESREGVALHHLRLYRTVANQTPQITADIQRLSATDLYLDAASHLPLILAFQTHPDDDFGVEIPVEVQFADYRLVNGVRVPFRMQKFLQGTLLLDITLSGATVNSGLSDNLFAVQVE